MSLLFLVSRAASDSDSDSKYVCPTKDTGGPAIVPFIGTLTYHQFSIILSGSCALLSTLMISVLIATHASNYLNRVQQRQVIRIALLITWVALFSFLIVWLEGVGEYLVESLDFGRAIALASFLLLMCDFVLSHRGGFDDLFGQGAESRDAFKGKSPTMLKVRAWSFFYISPTNLCSSAIGTASYNSSPRLSSFGSRPPSHSQSVPTANSPTAFISRTSGFLSGKSSSATIAILSCLRFYKQHKAKLQQHKILLKLFTFKSIIGLNVIQTFVISILSGHNILKPSKYLSYHDIDTGLAALILACEMPIFAAFMFVAFSPLPYKTAGPTAGPLSAIVDAFNISDLVSPYVRGPMRLVREQQRRILRQDSMRIGLEPNSVPTQQRSGVKWIGSAA